MLFYDKSLMDEWIKYFNINDITNEQIEYILSNEIIK
jgi:hypothetical protein